MKYLLASFCLILMASITGNAQEFFTVFNNPDMPGERKMTVQVNLRGLAPSQCRVDCIYSNDSMEVARALDFRARTGREPSAQANVSSIAGGRLSASIVLPHKDHTTPNTRDRNARTINNPSKVYFAWTRSHIPSGAREELTINSPIRSFTMPRVLIIAYGGDSYAAGEGAPADAKELNPLGNNDDMWLDEPCHRSERSGGVRAIRKLIADHPETAVRYVNVTCSGAVIGNLTSNQSKETMVGTAKASRLPQLLQIQNWLRENNRDTADILLLSIGGNDAGFAPTGTTLLLTGQIFFDDLKPIVESNLQGLAFAYDFMNDAINATDFRVGRVVIMGYPDPTRNESGRCHSLVDVRELCWGPMERAITREQFEYISRDFVGRMNQIQSDAASRFGWDRVAISAGVHGMCNCDEPYFNTLGQALGYQGDPTATMHPNSDGYRSMYRDVVYNQLKTSINTWYGQVRDERHSKAIVLAKLKMKDDAKRRALTSLKQYQTTIRLMPAATKAQNLSSVKVVKQTSQTADENDGKKDLGKD